MMNFENVLVGIQNSLLMLFCYFLGNVLVYGMNHLKVSEYSCDELQKVYKCLAMETLGRYQNRETVEELSSFY